jgi:HEAT repeat protein
MSMAKMTDKTTARIQRGQTNVEIDRQFSGHSDGTLIALLGDADAQKRTAAARLLGSRKCYDAIPYLCARLPVETALYTRLAICETIAAFGEAALPGLIELLGKIGNNRHEALPTRGFYKKSYPLPRDLAARTIIRIGPPALESLERVVQTGLHTQILEAMDAIGHVAFYSKDIRSENILVAAYEKYNSDPVVRWKIMRAFQSFPTDRVRELLLEIILSDEIPALRWEAVRSLGQTGLSVPTETILRLKQDPDEEVRVTANYFLK